MVARPVRGGNGRSDPGCGALGGAARGRRPRADLLRDPTRRLGPPVARAGADGGKAPPVPVLAVPGDPRAQLGPHPGHAVGAPHVRGDDPHAAGAARRHGCGRQLDRLPGRDLPVPDAPAHSRVPHGDRRGGHRLCLDRSAQRRLRGAVGRGGGGGRICRHREDDGSGRASLRTLPLGPLRHPGPSAELPLRRDGKSPPDLRDADGARRRQEPRVARSHTSSRIRGRAISSPTRPGAISG